MPPVTLVDPQCLDRRQGVRSLNLPSQALELRIVSEPNANRNPTWFHVVTDGVGRLVRREDAEIQSQRPDSVQIGADRNCGLAFFRSDAT